MTKRNKQNKQSNKKTMSLPLAYAPKLSPTTIHNPPFDGRDIVVPEVTCTTSFGMSEWSLNPRNTQFPGANHLARRYDRYCFEYIEFRWHSTTAVTTTPGIVILGWEPNSNNSGPQTIQEVNAMKYHSDGPVYSPNLRLRIPASEFKCWKYVRSGPIGGDRNIYDSGRLIVVTDKGNGTASGYVEAAYRIRFLDFHLENDFAVQHRVARLSNSTGVNLVSTGTWVNFPIDVMLNDMNGDLPESSFDSALNRVTPPLGMYLVECSVSVQNLGTAVDNPQFRIFEGGTQVAIARTTITNGRFGHVSLKALVRSSGSEAIEFQYNIGQTPYVLNTQEANVFITALS